jgi:hypothetical protein
MSTSADWLVIGNGAISRSILKYIPTAQALIRPGLDIRDEPRELPSTSNGYAVICAAITGFGMCETYPDWSREINVIATAAMAADLHSQGWTVIMLSSNAAINPTTEYGQQKADLEKAWHWGPILRLPKVLHAYIPLLQNWIRLLKINHTIHAYTHGPIQPIGRSNVVEALRIVAPQPHKIYQISGPTVTWLTLARVLAERMGLPESLVQPQDSASTYSVMDSFPMRYLGWEPPTLEVVIDEVLDEWANE